MSLNGRQADVDQFLIANMSGLSILGRSTTDDGLKGRLLEVVEPFIRLNPGPTGVLPDLALSYFVIPNSHEVAIVARFADPTGTPGRNPSRILVGPSEALSVPMALGLTDWSGWHTPVPPGQRPPRLSSVDLQQEAGEIAPDLRHSALVSCRQILVSVLAQLVRRPLDPLRVVGCPQDGCAAVMWGLQHVADASFRARGAHRTWTFSTYETEASEGMPENLFLPAAPNHRGPGLWVDLTTEAPTIETKWLAEAERLIDHALSGQPPAENLPAYPEDEFREAAARARAEDVAQQRRRPLQPQSVPAATSYADPPRVAPARIPGNGGGVRPSATPGGASRPPRGPSGPPAPGMEPGIRRGSGQGYANALGMILGSDSEAAYREGLAELAAQPPSPSDLRQQLGSDGVDEVVSKTVALVGPKDRLEVYDRWLTLLFGEGLADLRTANTAQHFLDEMVRYCQSDRFVDLVLRRVKPVLPSYNLLAGSLAYRYLVTHEISDAPAEPGSAYVGLPGRRRSSLLEGAGAAAVAAALALVLVGLLSFLIGQAVGSGGQKSDVSSVPQFPTPAPTTNAVPTAKNGGAEQDGALPVPFPVVPPRALTNDESVYLLLESEDGALLVVDAACVKNTPPSAWTCTPKVPEIAKGKLGLRPKVSAVYGKNADIGPQLDKPLSPLAEGQEAPPGMTKIDF